MNIPRSVLKDKTIGSLVGVAIGDALGLPVECKSPAIIRQTFGYIDGYVTNKHHNYQEVAKRACGTISDDTQLTLAMMDALAGRGGYDIQSIRHAHVEAWEGKWGKPLGWGGTTRAACEKIKNNETVTYIPDGGGNGPPMKIAPLAIYCVYKTMLTPHGYFSNAFNHSLLKKCKEIAMLTHGHPACIVAAYCQARMIIRALQGQMQPFPKRIAKEFIEDAQYAEEKLNVVWPELGRLSERLIEFLAGEKFERDTNAISTDICTDRSSFVLNSYPLVAYCVCKYHPHQNFRFAVCQTVNAGADADSNGSMVGAIMGASLGFSEIPKEMVRGLKQWQLILQSAQNFEQSI